MPPVILQIFVNAVDKIKAVQSWRLVKSVASRSIKILSLIVQNLFHIVAMTSAALLYHLVASLLPVREVLAIGLKGTSRAFR